VTPLVSVSFGRKWIHPFFSFRCPPPDFLWKCHLQPASAFFLVPLFLAVRVGHIVITNNFPTPLSNMFYPPAPPSASLDRPVRKQLLPLPLSPSPPFLPRTTPYSPLHFWRTSLGSALLPIPASRLPFDVCGTSEFFFCYFFSPSPTAFCGNFQVLRRFSCGQVFFFNVLFPISVESS